MIIPVETGYLDFHLNILEFCSSKAAWFYRLSEKIVVRDRWLQVGLRKTTGNKDFILLLSKPPQWLQAVSKLLILRGDNYPNVCIYSMCVIAPLHVLSDILQVC